MPTVAIGCPVAHRSWILDAWFDHVETACKIAGIEPVYVFVGDNRPEGDKSFEVIYRRVPHVLTDFTPNAKGTDAREWNQARYKTMVGLRNQLLQLVRGLDVDLFLSLDSDILVHPDALANLLDDMTDDDYDAVGGKCFMTQTGTTCPSWARLSPSNQLQRYDTNGYFPVQIIMAIKLMRPSAYRVDYELHSQGEDIGWSLACQRAGLKFGWDGRVGSKHVLAPHLLHQLDARVGY